MKKIILSLSLLISTASFAFTTSPNVFTNTKYDLCFTPGEACTEMIVGAINSTKKELLIQAYSFTSAPIAKAVVEAHNRGVNVRVILDKSQFSAKYSSAKFLQHHNIPVWNDELVAIAHNKVMILDNAAVITGSFNFTKAAQQKNAENLLIIYDANLAQKYKNNWLDRLKVSEKAIP